jgi:hypothetical protein
MMVGHLCLDNASVCVYHILMLDLFSLIPLRMQDISGGYVQSQIQIHEKDLFTGIFHLSYKKTEHILFFLQGKLVSIYQLGEGSWEVLPNKVWNDIISASRGDLRVLPLPVDGLRLYRILLESDFGEPLASKELPASELVAYFSVLPRDVGNTLSVVRQGESAAVLLLASENASVADGAIFSTTLGAQVGPGILHQVLAWGNRMCQLYLCRYKPSSEGWKEFTLRNSYSDFVRRVLTRYEELAGRFLVSDIDEQVNEECNTHMWAISMHGRALSNRHFFDTTQNAARVYSALLEIMEEQMEMVIGSKMVAQILQEALVQLPLDARHLLREQVIARTGLGGMVVKMMG